MYEINSQELPNRHSDFKGYLQSLQRRKWIILLCLAVATTGAALFNEFSTPVYEAAATILCQAPGDSDLLSDGGRAALTRSAMINLIEQLKSRALTEELAQALPEQIVRTFKPSTPLSGNLSQKDVVVGKIQESLSLAIVPGSDILQIKVTAHDPETAKIVANTYVERIIDWNSRKRRNETSNTLEFAEKQAAIFEDKLAAAEEALRAFKETNRMAALSNASAEMLGRMTDAEAKYNEAKTEREALEERQRLIEKKQRALAPSLTIGSSPLVDQLKKRLMELETRRAALELNGAAPEQSQLLSIKQEMGRVKEQLIQQLEKAAPIPSDQIRNLLQEAITVEVNLETCRAKEQGFKNMLATYDREIQALPKQEVELARLTRERDVNEKIYSMLQVRLQELRMVVEANKFDQVQLIDAARAPIAPVKPQKAKNLALGFFLGLTLGVGLVFMLEALDTSLKSPKDVEERMHLPVLAAIPSIHPNSKRHTRRNEAETERSYAGRLLSQIEAGSHIYEAYRALQIKFAMVNGSTVLKSILVTSPNAAEGKTLTAINMAHAFARNGIRTLLVDCDLRRPMIHHILGLEQQPGLSDLLRNNIVLIEKVACSWALQVPQNENLFVFPCGTLPSNPYELLTSQRMREVLAAFKRRYDLVILDSPPLMAVTDSIVLGSEVDGVCLVLKSGRTRQDVALRAKRLLENSQTNIIGTILNDIDTKIVSGYDTSHDYVS